MSTAVENTDAKPNAIEPVVPTEEVVEVVEKTPSDDESEAVEVVSIEIVGDESAEPVDVELSPFDIHFDMLLEDLEKIIGNGEINPMNVFSVTINLMQVTEGYGDLKGVEKKDLVLKVLKKFLENHGGDHIGNDTLIGLLPSFIDAAIDLDKGEVTIKVNTKSMLACCSGLLTVLKKKK